MEQEQNQKESKPFRSRRFLVIYSIVLFSLAMLLILVSYFSQVKAKSEVQTLSEQLTTAQGSLSKMESITELAQKKDEEISKLDQSNGELREEILSLQEKLYLSGKETEEQKRVTEAYAKLCQLEEAVRSRDFAAAEEVLAAMEQSGADEKLDPDAKEIFEALKERIR